MAMQRISAPTVGHKAAVSRPVVRPFTARRPTVVARAAAAPESPVQTKEWFALEQNRETDFFIVPEPVWLDKKFPELAKQVKRPCVALISTDKAWITFMKLRLDRVLRIDLKDMPDSEVLAVGGEVPEFKQEGKWTAPYARYTPGWWNVFVPKH
ncbi:hypothetical protein PLESTB_000893700 [Pleodorina starrii]|uniref:Uncharacterized protein n=1 Tax=Pleodorina starrii TaxID=330485 RepID=A0A9W6BM77_9CHLO|nr:hypothetical protein PLESTB_000893700 [Pleodorina starrii]